LDLRSAATFRRREFDMQRISFLRARFVAALVVASALAAPSALAQYSFNSGNGHYYTLTPPGTLASARAAAAALGGHLVTIDDPSENLFVLNTFLPMFSSPKWIGLSDEVTEGTFVWDNGAPVAYTSWGVAEPNGGAAHDGVVAQSPPLPITAVWADVSATANYQGIVELTTIPGDDPAHAWVVSGDTTAPYNASSMSIAGPMPSCNIGPASAPKDVWFRYTATTDGLLTVSNCAASVVAPGGFASASLDTFLAIWSDAGGAPGFELSCADGAPQCGLLESEASTCVTAGQTYYVQVGPWQNSFPTPSGVLAFRVGVPPGSDLCPCAPPLSLGLNGPFDNTFTTDHTSTFVDCAYSSHDLWFKYVPTETSVVTFSTIGPNQLTSGTLGDPSLSVWDGCGGPMLACDDAPPLLPVAVKIVAHAGQDLRIRVAGGFAAVGTFTLTVTKELSALVMTSPSGPGSILVENFGATPSTPYLTIFTLNSTGFPNGAFFGISPNAFEITTQIAANAPPFVGLLDGNARSAFGPIAGLPPLTLYAVTLFLDSSGIVSAVSPPYAHAIP
jgi:hypothetical protein